MLKRFLRDESGTTAIEYALIASLISVGIIGALSVMTGELGSLFGDVEAAVASAND